MSIPYRWRALALLVAMAYLNYFDRDLIYPLLNEIGTDLKLAETQLGLLTTGFYTVYAFSAPLLGYVSDHVSRKRLLTMMLIGWSCLTALSGSAGSFFELMAWRSLTGLGEGGYFPTAISLIGDLFPTEQRGIAIAIQGAANTFGGLSGRAAGGILGEAFGWRIPFLLVIIPGLLLAFVLWRSFQEPRRGEPAPAELAKEPTAEHRWKAYWAVISDLPVFFISLASAGAGYVMNGLNTWFIKFLQDSRGTSVAKSGILGGLGYGVTLPGQFAGGLLADRFAKQAIGVRPVLVASAYVMVVPIVLLLDRPKEIAVVNALYGLSQFCRGFAEPNLYGTILDCVEPGRRGAANGFMLALTFAGAGISPSVTGYWIERWGYAATWIHVAIVGALTAAIAFGVVLLMRRRDRLQSVGTHH